MRASPSLLDIFVARRRLIGLVRRTPLVRSEWLSRLTGAEVHLKLESLQVTGSFKVRGALNAVLTLGERGSDAGSGLRLVTASAGNHGLALAHASSLTRLPLVAFTPRTAPRAKLQAIGRFGADLRAVGQDYEDAERLAMTHAEAGGGLYISPYNDPDVIAGAGTVGLEILEDLPDVDVIVVPVGGGGLAAGVAIAAKSIAPRASVIGAEAAASPAFSTSLRAGRIVEVPVTPTIADGLAGNMDPKTITFALVQRWIDEVVTVPEPELLRAIRELAANERLIAEGAGATGIGAVLGGRIEVQHRRVAIVVSGSNIDLERLIAACSNGA